MSVHKNISTSAFLEPVCLSCSELIKKKKNYNFNHGKNFSFGKWVNDISLLSNTLFPSQLTINTGLALNLAKMRAVGADNKS